MATVLELAWKESAFVALVVVAAVHRGHRRRSDVAAVLGAGPGSAGRGCCSRRRARPWAPSALVVLVYTRRLLRGGLAAGPHLPEPLPVLAFRLFGSIELTDRPAAAAAAAVGAALALGVGRRGSRPRCPDCGTALAPEPGAGVRR